MDLMSSRVLVLYWYPGSPFQANDVLELSNNHYRNKYGSVSKEDVEKCPALFLNLEWYEYRNEDEIPIYLKGYDGVFKVLKHLVGLNKQHCKCFNGRYDTKKHYRNLVPATYEEYKNHLGNIKKVC